MRSQAPELLFILASAGLPKQDCNSKAALREPLFESYLLHAIS